MIDLQLLTLDNNTITVNSSAQRNYSPFSDGYPNQPSRPLSPLGLNALQSPSSQPFEHELNSQQSIHTELDSQQSIHTKLDSRQSINTKQIQVANKAKVFAWTFAIEEAMFNKLVHQVELGKRADSGFKKEA